MLVVIRLQPFIPGISNHDVEELVEDAYNAGAKQVIVESLRDELARSYLYRELAYEKEVYDHQDEWEHYSSPEEPSRILRPSIRWRRAAYLRVKELCDRFGIKFVTCKEGLYDYHTAENCCGMHLLDKEKYVLRPTLYEVWRYYEKKGYVPKFNELVEELLDTYLFEEMIRRYPKPLKKKVESHEKILKRVLNEERGRLKALLSIAQLNHELSFTFATRRSTL